MIKAWKHLCTILHHKNLVRAGCFKIGLYKQGLLHDMSKYTPTEFLVGCKYYQGTMSPNNAEREDKGYTAAKEVRTLPKKKTKNTLPHGFTIKDEINIIWSTGLIMGSVMEEMDKKHIAGSVA